MWYLYANGYWLETLPPTRGELFGDGVFETIRVWKGRCLFLSDHLRRLREAAQVLSLSIPLSLEVLEAELTRYGQAHEEARLKLVLYRAGEGTYAPPTSESHLRLGIVPLAGGSFPLGVAQRLVVFPGGFTAFTPWSAYKTLSSIGYVQAAAYARLQGCDDSIVLSAEGYIAETSRANLFFWDGKVLHTPSLRTGCVRGILRAHTLQAARQLGVQVREGFYRPEQLSEMQEVFSTNVIQGIVPILGIRGVGITYRIGDGTLSEAIARTLKF
ncbi:MAG: aminotransferase class IV [Bacteroidia bacterium]|nr:aminotransferase class IV [Bacteroidia bacterium]